MTTNEKNAIKRIPRAQVIAEWTADLRSGKIPQGKDKLAHKEDRCCLGVLCDIAVRHGVIPPQKNEEYGAHGDDCFLPSEVVIWSGIASENGTYKDGSLSLLNDQGKSFEKIADVIETRADELFEPEVNR